MLRRVLLQNDPGIKSSADGTKHLRFVLPPLIILSSYIIWPFVGWYFVAFYNIFPLVHALALLINAQLELLLAVELAHKPKLSRDDQTARNT